MFYHRVNNIKAPRGTEMVELENGAIIKSQHGCLDFHIMYALFTNKPAKNTLLF